MSNLLFLFQDAVSATDTVVASKQAANANLYEIVMNSGTMGIIIVASQLLMSLYAGYVIFERYMAIKRAANVDDSFMQNIRLSVKNSNLQAARSLCANTDTPVARMVGKGLDRIGRPLEDIRVAVNNVGNLEVMKLEKNISHLATISGASPMLGFMGTVTGMMSAFQSMANSTGAVSPASLAGGIYQALVTTAFGLGVGIMAYIAYNLLTAYIEKTVLQIEASSMEFLDVMQEPV